MNKVKYFFLGGAYADTAWIDNKVEDDQWQAWSCGELLILKVDQDFRFYQPAGEDKWKEVTQIKTTI